MTLLVHENSGADRESDGLGALLTVNGLSNLDKALLPSQKSGMFFVCFLYVICQKYVFSMFLEMAGSKSMFFVCF